MRRRPFTVLAMLSLVLCVAMLALWVRSYFARDAFGIWFTGPSAPRGRVAGLISTDGSVSIASVIEGRPPYGVIWSTKPRDRIAGELGFGWKHVGAGEWILSVPHWLVILLAAGLFWGARHGGKLNLPGTCKQCGYDLRATPNRCPECGSEVVTGQSAASVPP